MEDGKALIKLWLIAIFSIFYCYSIPSRISHGVPRLLSLLPIIIVFFILPLPISTVHLAFPTFYYLVWLGNFKLLLFAFNRGPLSSKPRLPLLTFTPLALLPIIPKQTTTKIILDQTLPFSLPKPIVLTTKVAILIAIVHIYQNIHNLHWAKILALHISYMYIVFELSLAVTDFLVRIFLGFDFETEPQYNEPYMATSLQDFWGRRWNLVSSSILRDAVYNPVRVIITPALGKMWGQMVGIFVTFVVSGVMHELMFYYVMRVPPTWEVTWFFVLQGVGTAAEVPVKKAANGRFQLNRVVSWMFTLVFLVVTGGWLFFAQPLRNGMDVKVMEESSVLLKIFR